MNYIGYYHHEYYRQAQPTIIIVEYESDQLKSAKKVARAAIGMDIQLVCGECGSDEWSSIRLGAGNRLDATLEAEVLIPGSHALMITSHGKKWAEYLSAHNIYVTKQYLADMFDCDNPTHDQIVSMITHGSVLLMRGGAS